MNAALGLSLLIMLLAMSCTGGNKTSQSTTQNEADKKTVASVDSTLQKPAATTAPVKPQIDNSMTGRKTVLIYGPASKVTYSDGRFYEFNKDGNIVRKKDDISNPIVEYRYVNKNRYMIENDRYNITYTKNSRHEIWDSSEKLEACYEFDNKGRLSKESPISYDYELISMQYYYKDNELLPYKVVTEIGDEQRSETTTSLYTYKTIDNNGNWTSCDIKNTITVESNEDNSKKVSKENQSLTRKIEYYQ